MLYQQSGQSVIALLRLLCCCAINDYQASCYFIILILYWYTGVQPGEASMFAGDTRAFDALPSRPTSAECPRDQTPASVSGLAAFESSESGFEIQLL